MILCPKHLEIYNANHGHIGCSINSVMGDAWCEKHNIRFPFYETGWKEYCPVCANEKNICQYCGEIVK